MCVKLTIGLIQSSVFISDGPYKFTVERPAGQWRCRPVAVRAPGRRRDARRAPRATPRISAAPATSASPGRHFHSTLPLTVIDCHCLRIYATIILLSSLSFSFKMTVSPLANISPLNPDTLWGSYMESSHDSLGDVYLSAPRSLRELEREAPSARPSALQTPNALGTALGLFRLGGPPGGAENSNRTVGAVASTQVQNDLGFWALCN